MKREVITVHGTGPKFSILGTPCHSIWTCTKELTKALGKRPRKGMRLVLLDLDEWEIRE